MNKIEKLKKEARKHYIAYESIARDYGCGLTLAEHISPAMAHHKIKFNDVMDELAKIDPTTPTFRL